jgi:hypothetical protein
MGNGTLPPRGRWLSGYFFNSALLRIAAARHQTEGLLRALGRQAGEASALITLEDRFAEISFDSNQLKHDREGVGAGRTAMWNEAVESLCELLAVLEANRESSRRRQYPGGRLVAARRSPSDGG